jgi:lactate dehydrogenase-like 2-hydroxyacid dehydrogenase
MPEKVLVYSRFPKSLMQRIGERFDLLDAGGKRPHEVFANEELAAIRAMITQGSSLLNGEMMDRLPKLKAIVCYGTGHDGIDLKAAAHRGIAVGHSPGANASSVADVAVTLMLAAVRRLLVADTYVRSGDWAAAKPSAMMRAQQGMRGRKVGIYGMGAIGGKIAARAAVFETEVGYFSRSRHALPYQYFSSLEALAQWCSVLVIAVRAGPETDHVVNADILKRLGTDGYVVNIARGSVIDEDALVAALKDKTIAGAGLDVYGREPHHPDRLTAFPNVVLTPHIGGHTLESHQAMQDCVMANLAAFFEGKPLPYEVKGV